MDNMINTEFKRKLPVPKEIKEKYPLSPEATKIKEARDKEIERQAENNRCRLQRNAPSARPGQKAGYA